MSFLALKAKYNLLLQVEQFEDGKQVEVERPSGKDLNVAVTNLGHCVGVMLDVTNVPALVVLDAVASKAGWKWERRNNDIVVNVASAGEIHVDPTPSGGTFSRPVVGAPLDFLSIPYAVDCLGARIVAMEHSVEAMKAQFDAVKAAVTDRGMYAPVVVDWLEGSADTNASPNQPVQAVGKSAPDR